MVCHEGTMWTASAHIITAVIGSGVLSLAWAIAQLGWVAGPAVMLLFSFVTYYTSALLADCYRSGDPCTGKRNYTYMDAVNANLSTCEKNPPRTHARTHAILGCLPLLACCRARADSRCLSFPCRSFRRAGGIKVQLCGFLQYANIVGVAIGYTIAASISML